MKDLINNGIVQGALAALVAAFVIWMIRAICIRMDEKKIITFLQKSAAETELHFRTTHAIASATSLPEERVSKICGRSRRIRRNQKEKESWILEG